MSSSLSSPATAVSSPYLLLPVKEEPVEDKFNPMLLVANESLDDSHFKPEPFLAFKSEPIFCAVTTPQVPLAPLREADPPSDSGSDDDETVDEESSVTRSSSLSSEHGPRKEFRTTVALPLYQELEEGKLTYDQLIEKYKALFPQHSNRFTKNFLTKLRTGRVCNAVTGLSKRRVKNGDPKMKRVTRISSTRKWAKMTDQLVR